MRQHPAVFFRQSKLTRLSVVHSGEEEAVGRGSEALWEGQRVPSLHYLFQLGNGEPPLSHGHQGPRHPPHLKKQK